MNLILASASPRRAALLRDAGYTFTVHPADVDEEAYFGKLFPTRLAPVLAKVKLERIANDHPDDLVLAADTLVAFGDTPLGKPTDERDAREMIELLSGATHVVITAIALRCLDRKSDLSATAMSAVRMRTFTNADLDTYLASNRWQGKAGAYGIQDPDPIVTCIAGSVSNVIGLPMKQTRALLHQAGITPTSGAGQNHVQ